MRTGVSFGAAPAEGKAASVPKPNKAAARTRAHRVCGDCLDMSVVHPSEICGIKSALGVRGLHRAQRKKDGLVEDGLLSLTAHDIAQEFLDRRIQAAAFARIHASA